MEIFEGEGGSMNIYSGDCEHGKCGLSTDMKDDYGNVLFVGDIVALATRDKFGITTFHGITVVVDHRPDLVGDINYKKPFIMGIATIDINKDTEWFVSKVKDWSDCIDGEHWKDYGFNYR
jgi:hypothetical protein